MTTTQEMEIIQLFRNADDADKMFLVDMLLCFVYCGEDFIQEIQAAQEDKEAMQAVVTKYVATVKEEVVV